MNHDFQYFCGGRFNLAVDLSDSTHTVFPEFIPENYDCSDKPIEILIKLIAMDQNYYDYFLVGGSKRFENFLLEVDGNSGNNKGIQGGFGVFGSYATDKLYRIINP